MRRLAVAAAAVAMLAVSCTASTSHPAASPAALPPDPHTASALLKIAAAFNHDYDTGEYGPVYTRWDARSQAIITRADYLKRHKDCPGGPTQPTGSPPGDRVDCRPATARFGATYARLAPARQALHGSLYPERKPQMRIGISGTHGTGKTTLAEALCAHLPGHVTADEPYYLLEEEGYEFGFPPSLEDYRALLARSVQSLTASLLPGVVFDRTPLDYLAYMAATGVDPSDEATAAALRPAFGSLHLLVITPITPETEQVLPAAELPGLRSQMNEALLELVSDDPFNAWEDVPVLELDRPLHGRLDAVLAALDQSRHPRLPRPNA